MVEASYNLGLLLLKRGDTANAIQAFEKAIELKPDPEFYVALGTAYLRLSELVKAKQAFNQGLSLNARSVSALQGVAVVKEREGDSGGSIKTLEDALAIEPQNTISQFNLGALYERSDQKEKAVSQYRRLLK